MALLETRTAVTDVNVVNDNNNDYGGNFTPENMATNEISAEDLAKQTAILNNTLNAISPWLGDFTDLLTNPPNLTVMRTTAGVLDPPLGQTRLRKCLKICGFGTDLGSPIGNTRCGNFGIFLPLGFYVRSILVILKPQKLPFQSFEQV